MKLNDLPAELVSFATHGLTFTDSQVAGDNWYADCPFCGKEKHFFVDIKTSQYHCKVCGEKGNKFTYIKERYTDCLESTTAEHYARLAKDRGVSGEYTWKVPATVFKSVGMAYDVDTGLWLLPMYNDKKAIANLRHYEIGRKGVYGTKGMSLWPVRFGKSRQRDVWLCEGEWDGMFLKYLLRKAGVKADVISFPGATTFKTEWVPMLAGLDVVVAYDNDDPGDTGSLKAAAQLQGVAKSVRFVNWPESRPLGFDIRDFVIRASCSTTFKSGYRSLMKLVSKTHRRSPEAESPTTGDVSSPEKREGPVLKSVSKLLGIFGEHILLDEDLGLAVKLMLAVIVSNAIPGDPLWMFIVGPPGSGKTMLLHSLSRLDVCVFRSTIRANMLVSGFKSDTDPSLIPQLNKKVFVLKDYTEVLDLPEMEKDAVFSILRGAYDGRVSRSYGHGVVRDYESQFSMLAGVTTAIHGNGRATLGERFLKFQLLKDTAFKADAQIRAAMSMIAREGIAEKAMQDTVSAFLNRHFKTDPEHLGKMIPSWVIERIVGISQLIAMLRAEVDRDWKGDSIIRRPQHEMGTRLAKQLQKLAVSLAMIEGKRVVDEAVYRIVERVAFDTAIGFHLDMVSALVQRGGQATRSDLSDDTKLPATNMDRHLQDLVMLGVLRKSNKKERNSLGRGQRVPYYLTSRVKELWDQAQIGAHSQYREVAVRRRRSKS